MANRFEKLVSWALIAALTVQPAILSAQSIQVIGPDNGPRPHVDQSYNGTTVLNIGRPNSAGVSHDVYTEFKAGDLILNNSATNVYTQQGGWIEGNPNMRSDHLAKVWIGEVIGGSQTELTGMVEVGGQKMDVVLANEFGITCNGCGFVNTSRTTLTTGKPVLRPDGSLTSFDVKQGVVSIQGDGLNPESRLALSDTARVDVIARAALVYGKMRADQLNLVTGANVVDYNWSYDPETGAVTGITPQVGNGPAPALAVDVSALGGMYANAIQMVATERGVGVNIDGEMASSSNIALRSDGQLTLGAPAGTHVPKIKSRQKVIVRNRGPVLLQGSVISEANDLIDIQTSEGSLTFSGQASGGAVTLQSAGLAHISAAITAQNAFKVESLTESVTLADGSEISAASIDVDAVTTANLSGKAAANAGFDVLGNRDVTMGTTAELSGATITLQGKSADLKGKATATSNLNVTTTEGALEQGAALSGADVTLTSAAGLNTTGKVSADNLASLNAATQLTQTASSEVFGTNVTLQGATLSLDGVNKATALLDADSLTGAVSNAGILLGNQVDVDAATTLTNAGQVAGNQSATLRATSTLTTATTSKITGGTVTLEGASLDLEGQARAVESLSAKALSGDITADADLMAKAVTLETPATLTQRGKITGVESTTLKAGTTLGLQAGSETHGGDITFEGETLSANALVKATGTLATDIGSGGVSNTHTLSGDVVELSSDGDISNSGIVTAGSTLTVETPGRVTNVATLLSGDDLAIYADEILNNGGVIWANDAITLAANAALDKNTLVQNTNGRIEAFQGDLTIRTGELANLGTQPSIGQSTISKWLEKGNDEPFDPMAEMISLIDPAYLGADDRILPAYSAQYTALFADLLSESGTLSAEAKSILKSDVMAPSGTTLTNQLKGRWGALNGKAAGAGEPDPEADVKSFVDPAIFDADGKVLAEHAQAYAAFWDALASGATTVSADVKAILDPELALVVGDPIVDPDTGVETPVYTDELRSEVTDLWGEMTVGASASYDIVKILYQDRFADDGQLAELIAGGKIDIQADSVRNIFANISAGDDIMITANTVENKAMGASQVLMEVHKKPGCFTCHEGEVEFYDTFGGRIEATGNVTISGSLSNVTLNSSELSFNEVMAEMNQYIQEQQAAGDADLTGVPLVATTNFHLEEHRKADYNKPVQNVTEADRKVSATDTGSQTTVEQGQGTPLIVPVEPGAYAPTVEVVVPVTPELTPTASVDALLAAGLNTIAETNDEFTAYANFITSNYMMDVDRLQYRDNLLNNTDETILAALAKSDVIAEVGDLDYLNQPIEVPARDGLGTTTIFPANSNFALDGTGALIKGETVALSGNAIDNSAAIQAQNDISIVANSITGTGGQIATDGGTAAITALAGITFEDTKIDANKVDIIAGQDFVGKGVKIASKTDTSIYATTGVTLTTLTETYTLSRGNGTITHTVLTDANLDVGGDLSIVSGGDLVLAGVSADIKGDAALSADGNAFLTAVQSNSSSQSGSRKKSSRSATSNAVVTRLGTGGDLSISAEGSAVLVGTGIASAGAVNILAGDDIMLETATSTYDYDYRKSKKKKRLFGSKKSKTTINEQRVTNQGVSIDAEDNVTVAAGGQAVLVGTQIDTRGTARIQAAEDVILAAAQDIYTYNKQKKKKSGLGGFRKSASSKSITQVTNKGAKIAASGQIDVISDAGNLTTAGTAFASNNGDINLSATLGDIYAGTYTDIFQSKTSKSKSSVWGLIRSSSDKNINRQFQTGTDALAALDLSLVSGADTTLVGAQLSAGRNLNINTGGDLSVEAALSSQREQFFSQNMGLVTMTTIQESSYVETAALTQLLAGAALNLNVDGATKLTVFEKAGVDAQTLSDLYPEELLAIEGLELITQELANEYFYDKQTQLSPIGQLLLQAVIAATGIPAPIASVVNSVVSQAVSGEFDPGQIFLALASNYIGAVTPFDVKGANALLDPGHWGNQLVQNTLNEGLSAVVAGTDFNIETVILKTATSFVEGAGFNLTGETRGLTNVLLKGVVGCAAGELRKIGCGAGAAASVTEGLLQELGGYASLQDAGWEPHHLKALTMLTSGLAAGLAAGTQDAVNTGAGIGVSAFQNNYLLHKEQKRLAHLLACARGEPCEESEGLSIEELLRLDAARDQELADCQGDYSETCTKVRAQLYTAVADYAEAQELNPDLRNNRAFTSFFAPAALRYYKYADPNDFDTADGAPLIATEGYTSDLARQLLAYDPRAALSLSMPGVQADAAETGAALPLMLARYALLARNARTAHIRGDAKIDQADQRVSGARNSRPSHLTSHPNAHTVERHGPQVTDQQLETRALTGVAPDGSTLTGNRIPPLSSAFHSEGAMLRADSVMRGQPLQDAIAANPTATGHTITFDVGENIGRGYRRIGSGNPNNVGRNGPPERVDGLTHAQARVELNQATGEWETITMFPTLP